VNETIILNEAISHSDSSMYRLPESNSLVCRRTMEVTKINISSDKTDIIANELVLPSPTLSKLSERLLGMQMNAKIRAWDRNIMVAIILSLPGCEIQFVSK
tara:strand:+ start:160 stop:462 length:303 start_codon:yes stop_codon:yes gene_type:complete